MNDKVTVMMPVYNGEKYISEAIESIQNQSYQNYELIILNDGSTDNTEKVIKGFLKSKKIKYYKFDMNQGKVAAVNKIYTISKGDFYVLLAADDVLERVSIEKRVQAMEKYNVAFSNLLKCDANLKPVELVYNYKEKIITWEKYKYQILFDNIISGGAIIFNKTYAEKVFPIPETLAFEDWWITFFLLFSAKEIYYIDMPLIKYRIHGKNDNGNIDLKNIDDKIKKNYSRHLNFYNEIKKYLIYKEFAEKNKILKLIEINKNYKELVIKGKFLPFNSLFIEKYGISKYIINNLISKNISYYPRILRRYILKIKYKFISIKNFVRL